MVVGPTSQESLSTLGPVWYYSYGYTGPTFDGHERVYLVRPSFDEKELRKAMRADRRAWWFVGNEPNDPFQDDLSPDAYARLFRRVERVAQTVHPSPRLTSPGIANADWRWAQAFLDGYRTAFGRDPLVSAWNIHNYVLDPGSDQLDVKTFQRRVLDFRAWMADSGQDHLPLFLSEFGALYAVDRRTGEPLDERRAVSFMDEVVGWMAGGDNVQAWAWFANDTRGQFAGDLFAHDGGLTVIGQGYQRTVEDWCAGGSDMDHD